MTTLREDTAGKIRDKPIKPELRELLIAAAEACGIDRVVVTSGGQDAKGTPHARRTGSTRHDLGNAADLVLEREGRRLSFTKLAELPFFENFIAAAVARGATGVGAGLDYMGAQTMHVGFGAPSAWGAGGKSANAPSWLRKAFERGRAAHANGTPVTTAEPHQAAAVISSAFVVTARSGLRLRAGPGTQFPTTAVLPAGTRLNAVANGEWAQVDLEGDGLADGFVFASFIATA